ncbi:MAG TPA: glycosyltransferase family 39 protein [Thermoanaerobaculia bacterium]|nr:glycosyltransferase family 39 protein [Thermoanaerobaculia bacterium]
MHLNAGRKIWLAGLFVLCVTLALARFAGPGPYGLDASYYVQIARHVANGEGLTSTVSLYHSGFVLPARTTVSPMLPLLIGYASRVIGFERAVNAIPKLFYLLDLLMVFLVARRLGAPIAVTTLLATNAAFYAVTTHPYREGPAFFFALLALWLIGRYFDTRANVWAIAAGFALGCAYLSRVEMALIGVASVLVMLWLRDRRAMIAIALYGLAALIVILPWWLHLGVVPGLERFFAWNPIPRVELPPIAMPVLSPSARALDVLAGAITAFRIGHPESYVRVFGLAALLVPIACVCAIWRRKKIAGTPSIVHVTLLAGLLHFAALLWTRSDAVHFMHFLFGWRYGLSLLFLLLVAIPYLLASDVRWLRIGTIAILVVTILTGITGILDFIRAPGPAYSPAERALLDWLRTQARPMILTTNAQTLGASSDALLHAAYCDDAPSTTRAFLARLPIDYVVVYRWEARCAFVQGLGRELRPVRAFGTGNDRLYLLGRVTPGVPAR